VQKKVEVNSNKSNILFNNLDSKQERRILQILPFKVSPFDNGVKHLRFMLNSNDN
jgi:hypothetical protein